MSYDKMVRDAEQAMQKAVEFLKQELRGVRSGRASAGLVDGIRVEVAAYGSVMGMKELATVAVAEANTIVIKPFDPGTLKDIARAIEKSDLGINPQNDGKMIRLPVPPLSTERRNQLASQVSKLGEAQKVSIRNVRRDANKALKDAEKAKQITEDQTKTGEKKIQDFTDKYTSQIDQLLTEKTKEIMEA